MVLGLDEWIIPALLIGVFVLFFGVKTWVKFYKNLKEAKIEMKEIDKEMAIKEKLLNNKTKSVN